MQTDTTGICHIYCLPSAIIHNVKHKLPRVLLVHLLAVLILSPLLGKSPTPNGAILLLLQAQQEMDAALDGNCDSSDADKFAQAAKFFPQRANLWRAAGRCTMNGDNPSQAIIYFEKAAKITAIPAETLVFLGDAYQQTGNLSSALECWHKATLSTSSSQLTLALYERLLQADLAQNNINAVIDDLSNLILLKPSEAEIHYALGLYLSTKTPKAAVVYLEKAAELDGSLSSTTQTLIRGIRSAIYHDDEAYQLLETGRVLASMGEWIMAAQAFNTATLTQPDYADAWAYLAEAQQHLDNSSSSLGELTPYFYPAQESLALIEHALTLNPKSLPANMFMALFWKRNSQFNRTLEYLNQAASIDPQNPTIQIELGSTMAILGNLQGALFAHQRAIDLAPNDSNYHRFLAIFSIKHNYKVQKTGLPAARKAVSISPNDPANLDVLAQTLILLEDYANAERLLYRSLQHNPDYAPAHLHLGLIYLFQEKSSLGIQEIELARNLAPESATAEQAKRLIESAAP